MKHLKHIKLFEQFTDETPSRMELIKTDKIPAPKGFKPSQNILKKGWYNVKGSIVAWIDKEDGNYRSEDTSQETKEYNDAFGDSKYSSTYDGEGRLKDILSSLKKHGYELQTMLPCELNPQTKVGYGSDRVAK